MKKKLHTLLLSLFFVGFSVVMAHEFWLQPNAYFPRIGEIVTIRFNVGENFTGENWKGNREKVQQLLLYTPSNAVIDVSNKLSLAKGDSLQIAFEEEGTQMIVFNSTNSFINLEAKKFNEYLVEDGLTNALNFRKSNNEDTIAGKEYYQRSVKTIVQCGRGYNNNCTQPTNLPLDIVPELNPYEVELINGKIISYAKRRYRILFNKTPLPNALVKHWFTKPDGSKACKNLYTNNRGWVKIDRTKGANMISCVYMERYTKDSTANWQSYWTSVTFEIRDGNFFIKGKSTN